MNRLFCLLILAAVAACANQHTSTLPAPPATSNPELATTATTNARIKGINEQFRFVVIDFGARATPSVGTTLAVYRADQRVGSVRITEPRPNHQATADIVEGELHVHNEVR